MPKKIEVLIPNPNDPAHPTSYHIPLDEAKHLTATNQGHWNGPRQIILDAYASNRCIWRPKWSGGATVLQLT